MGLNKNLVTWDNMDVSKIEEIYNLISPTIQFEFTNKEIGRASCRERVFGYV